MAVPSTLPELSGRRAALQLQALQAVKGQWLGQSERPHHHQQLLPWLLPLPLWADPDTRAGACPGEQGRRLVSYSRVGGG